MIPEPFEYHRPDSLAEAVALLANYGADGKILAGGHSLIPLMKLRLAAPKHFIDVGRIAGLDTIRGVFTDVAQAIRRFEPLTMLANPAHVEDAKARAMPKSLTLAVPSSVRSMFCGLMSR